MITQARREASRRNGRRSKGPKSLVGKAVSRRNAVKHGLGTAVLNDPIWHCDVVRLARALKADLPSGVTFDQAAEAAAPMVALMRSAVATTVVWDLAFDEAAREETQNPIADDGGAPEMSLGLRRLSDVVGRLSTMERYERRAQLECWRRLAVLEELVRRTAAVA